jgi:release factor glutamine methyltransferase
VILTAATRWLAPGGWLALETGVDHHPALGELARVAGYARSESLRDLAGRDRFFLAWKEGPGPAPPDAQPRAGG